MADRGTVSRKSFRFVVVLTKIDWVRAADLDALRQAGGVGMLAEESLLKYCIDTTVDIVATTHLYVVRFYFMH